MRRIKSEVLKDDVDEVLTAALYISAHYDEIPENQKYIVLESGVCCLWFALTSMAFNNFNTEYMAFLLRRIEHYVNYFNAPDSSQALYGSRTKRAISQHMKDCCDTMAQYNGTGATIPNEKLEKLFKKLYTAIYAIYENRDDDDFALFVANAIRKNLLDADKTNRPTFITEDDYDKEYGEEIVMMEDIN